ncbi:TetR/AcrR family transcriptional regulator [Pseudonocardia humida]|uniref:TetR family transcriptional regulator n=1 Tax=Pseudonocardia humida TaxID=2800819 RepID=A0ABT0ZSH1_9PSEU|nr:TetR family transcriptional regulator [Pseudonocardia humida]MCO1653670.1 TetR family transcriptional regulator [Pseudonocardia humida]
MPPPNEPRRRALADAAIALLAAAGVHGVTHRSVERAAGLPPGTSSNYFRDREALLVAAAERVVDLHHRDLDAAAATAAPPTAPTAQRVADLLTDSLLLAATTHRDRYLAVFELRLEARRRPALAAALDRLVDGSRGVVARHHAELDLAIPRDRIPELLVLYGGALFTLVTAPEAAVTSDAARTAAEALTRVALATAPT